MKALRDWLNEKREAGVKQVRVASVIAKLEEAEREAAAKVNGRPRTLDLVGTAEAAELLDVEAPRIGRYIKNGRMPQPLAILRSGPVWHRDTIVAYKPEIDARRRQRRR